MAKTITTPMRTHLQGEVTFLSTGWLVTRTDGQNFRFTTNATNVVIDVGDGDGPQTYSASEGYTRTNIQNDAELNVGNMDIVGVFDSAQITENDLRRGLFDFADVRIFIFNHQDLSTSMGVIKQFRGQFGEITVTPQGFFNLELRDLTQVYTKELGEFYSKDCRADVGDSRCRIPILPPVLGRSQAVTVGQFYRVQTNPVPPAPTPDSFVYEDRLYGVTTAGTTDASQPVYDIVVGNTTADGTAVLTAEEAWSRAFQVVSVTSARRTFKVSEMTPNSGGPRGGFPDDWLNGGAVTFETGLNIGRSVEVRDFVADDGMTIEQEIELFNDVPFDMQVGDRGRVFPGCDKTLTVCISKFDNVKNFVGEPYVPGEDVLGQYPDARS